MQTETALNATPHPVAKSDDFLAEIEALDKSLTACFSDLMVVDQSLTRQLVSFQANKSRGYYRWYKYKEAFSADLVAYLFDRYHIAPGRILDPFAGAGTALFAATSSGFDTEGIELLPVGQKIIAANIAARKPKQRKLLSRLEKWRSEKPWNTKGETKDFSVLRITRGAYPKDTEHKIKRYLHDLTSEFPEAQELLLFALLCVLETVGYTRKDGQYLRWDYRSGRQNGGKVFNKGEIVPFDRAILQKLEEITNDMRNAGATDDLFSVGRERPAGKVGLLKGSCLDILPGLKSATYTGIITSPPYCNRYDYTRTYALEHAILGVGETEQSKLRQAMLSCTVENREKALGDKNPEWQTAIEVCNGLPLLQKILNYLDEKKARRELNNNGIARMVRGYFYEMACVIQECHRVLKGGGTMFMVNDNVRYAGASISVDLILSKIAEAVGFEVVHILVLPQGKGNSAQQMGRHGREALRKCVYVWKKIE